MLTYVCNVKSDSDDSDEPEVCPLVVPTFDFVLADSESSGVIPIYGYVRD